MTRAWTRWLRWALWLAVFGAVAGAAWTNREALVRSVDLMARARVPWLVGAMLCVGGLYLCRAIVYGIPLRLLDYTVPWPFLWQAAIIASSVNQLIPTAGASSYAFLTYALHQRGVPSGQASLIALIDTLSYAFAAATVVLGSLAYLTLAGSLHGHPLLASFAPGAVLAGLAAWVYWLQRDRERFIPVALRAQQRLASLLGATWPEAPVRGFLEEYYKGKEVIGRRPRAFVKMVALQYLAVAADGAALYMTLLSLELVLSPAVVFLGFIVTVAAGTVVNAPAGGGSFEVIMSAYFARQGVDTSRAIAGALLFRGVTFWLPVLVSAGLILKFRNRKREIRRRRRPRFLRRRQAP